MVFSTYIFIFYFLPLVLIVYYGLAGIASTAGIAPSHISLGRNALLLVASYVFYGWWNPWFILLMLAITLVNYACGEIMSHRGASDARRFGAVVAAVVLSLGALGVFKYLMFFQLNVNWVLETLGRDTWRVVQVVLPVGISFYTFQALSYSVDVYRRTVPPARSCLDFACYIALFPQLIAGPIVRYHTVSGQLVGRNHTWDKFAAGSVLFILGLGKKVLLADPLGEAADVAFGAYSLTPGDAWFGAMAYALQIYFDFCGYSDMAVGLGRMIGFDFMRNFDAPYQSASITEFWQRWHISLSTFLRDYLYVPLGGNRRGARRTYFNLTLVMLLGGLWHGANWTFILWGLYHGLLLAAERVLGKRPIYHCLPRSARVLCTFVLVLFSWILFRADSMSDAVHYLSAMMGAVPVDESAVLVAAQLYSPTSLAVMVVGCVLLAGLIQAHTWSQTVSWSRVMVAVPLFTWTVMVIFTQSFSPFLYFQF